MPKGSKKSKSSKGLGSQLSRLKKEDDCRSVRSDDVDSNFGDTASVISYSSSKWDYDDDTLTNASEFGTNDDGSYYDDFEDKLLEAIDGVQQKSLKTRLLNLEMIKKALTTRFIYDFVMNRKLALTDMLEKCLKRKGEEMGSAALLTTMVVTTMGSCQETDDLFLELQPHLMQALTDQTLQPLVRSNLVIF